MWAPRAFSPGPYARAQSDVCAARVRGMWRLEVCGRSEGVAGALRPSVAGTGQDVVVRVGGRGCGPLRYLWAMGNPRPAPRAPRPPPLRACAQSDICAEHARGMRCSGLSLTRVLFVVAVDGDVGRRAGLKKEYLDPAE